MGETLKRYDLVRSKDPSYRDMMMVRPDGAYVKYAAICDLIPRDDITPQMAAEVLLNGVPNPIFDRLKYPLSGEFKVACFGYDEDGADAEWEVTVDWPTIKDIIRAALTAIKESKDD